MSAPSPQLWVERLEAFGRGLAQGLLQLLYPGTCFACAQPLPPDQARFCATCRNALTADPFPTCPRCAATVGPFVHLEDGCTHCREAAFRFERVLRLGPYDGLLRDLILRMKHRSGELLAEVVGALWAEQTEARLREVRADIVVPVPLHWRRRLARGYNQSEALARAVADRLGLPCRPSLLRRVRHTPQQTQQSPAGRRDNVRGAFAARLGRAFAGKSILLVDDVMTTGSTASEAARALREDGAARVVVAVLARAQG